MTSREFESVKLVRRTAEPQAGAADRAYAEGFTKACEASRQDPLEILKIAETLDLHL